MRIGIYIKGWDPNAGGAYTFQYSIIKELCGRGKLNHQFTVFSPDEKVIDSLKIFDSIDRIHLKQEEYRPDFSQKIKNRIVKPVNIKSSEPLLETGAKKKNIELIWYLDGWSCETAEIPFVYTVWDLQHRLQPFFPEISQKGIWIGRENHIKKYIHRAAYVLTGTERGRKELQLFYNIASERIKTLPHPTPPFVFDETITPDHSIIKKNNLSEFIFYPAQFWPHKNHIAILKAIKYLKEKYNLEIQAAFSGSDQGNLDYIKQKTKEYNLEKQIKFLGFVSINELKALYQSAIALVYATCFGAENLTPLKAFAMQFPVIASNLPGSEEQLGNSALFFSPENNIELSEKIYSLYNSLDLRKEFIAKGISRANQYTGKHYVDDMLSLFNEFSLIRHCWK